MLEIFLVLGVIGAIWGWLKTRSINSYNADYDKMHDYWMKHYD